jgi:hypothetical protein
MDPRLICGDSAFFATPMAVAGNRQQANQPSTYLQSAKPYLKTSGSRWLYPQSANTLSTVHPTMDSGIPQPSSEESCLEEFAC